MKNLYLFLILLCILSCRYEKNNNKQVKTFSDILSIDVESLDTAIYAIDSMVYIPKSLEGVSIYISPFNEEHILVFSDTNADYEIKTDFSDIKYLSDFLGSLLNHTHINYISADTYNDSLVWVLGGNSGFVIYNRISKKYNHFLAPFSLKGGGVSCVNFTKDFIWMGSSDNGLFKIRRNDLKIEKIPQFNGLSINEIVNINQNEILINDNYLFNIQTNEYKIFNSINGVQYNVINNYRQIDDAIAFSFGNNSTRVIFSNGISKDIMNTNLYKCFIYKNELWDLNGKISIYNYINDSIKEIDFNGISLTYNTDSSVWFIAQDFIYKINKDNKLIYRLPIEFKNIRQILICGDYLFLNQSLNNKSKIIRLTKQFIDKILVLNEIYLKEENDFRVELKLLTELVERERSSNLIANIDKFYKKYSLSKNQKIIRDLRENCEYLVSILKEKENILFNKNLYVSAQIKMYILYSLVRTHGINRDVSSSLQFYNLLKNEFPKSYLFNKISPEYIQSLINIEKELKLINQKQVSKDLKYWEKYLCFQKNELYGLFERGWLSRPYEFIYLDSILLLYPKSKYANEADWLINSLDFYDEPDPIYQLKDLIFYKNFVRKYPKSRYLPNAFCKMAVIYSHLTDSIELRLKYIDTAQFLYNKLKKEFPEFSKKNIISDVSNLKKDLLNTRFGWDLEITTNKLTYNLNEPIEIDFLLVNKTNYKRNFVIYEGMPNFKIEIDVNGDYEFIEIPINTKLVRKKILIEPYSSYNEKCNIMKLTNQGHRFGFVKLAKEQSLFIFSWLDFPNSERLQSNIVHLKIIK